MKLVKIDDDVYEYVAKHARYNESFAKILRRLLFTSASSGRQDQSKGVKKGNGT